VSLKAAITLIEKTKKLSHPLVIKILSNIYTTEVVGIMMRSAHADVARIIVLPRLKQKLAELARCRAKFEKVCEEVASKNFYKSLDYRCFYFCKNDKKFNCIARWEKEIELRKKEVIE
jgi:histone deacetylase complex regulatory component SIN3